MARPLRIDVEDGLYQVTSRRHGNDGRLAAIYLARRVTDEAVGAIGEHFGGVSAAAISKTVRNSGDTIPNSRVAPMSVLSGRKRGHSGFPTK